MKIKTNISPRQRTSTNTSKQGKEMTLMLCTQVREGGGGSIFTCIHHNSII